MVRIATMMHAALAASGWDSARASALALAGAAHLAVAGGLGIALLHETLDELYASAKGLAGAGEAS